MISVVIPTVTGREDHYKRCHEAYERTLDGFAEFEIITINDRPTCGIAWQVGADRAIGDYLHFSADDLEPHDGWAEAAVRSVDDGIIPMPTIYGPDGSVEPLGPSTQGCTRIPFCTMAQWEDIGPMIPAHYFTDNYFSVRAARAGFMLREVPEFAFSHHWAMPGRGAGMNPSDRMVHDHQIFQEAIS